jgi:hypothetical protein
MARSRPGLIAPVELRGESLPAGIDHVAITRDSKVTGRVKYGVKLKGDGASHPQARW